MKTWQKKLIKLVSPYLEKIGPEHEIDHSERVFKYCLIFSQGCKGVDSEALFAAAYLHDFGYLKNKKGGINHGQFALDDIFLILKKAEVPEKKLVLIKQIIKFHDTTEDLSKTRLPKEVSIFHDADKIDGSGAMGVARQFVYSGRVGKKIWNPKIKRNPSLPYGGSFSAIHSILDYHLKHRFYTKIAKKIAVERKKHMRSFVKEFFQEYNFKR